MSAASPGLNDYEISLYLTQAHKEIIYNYYSGNNKGDSFDSSEKTRTYLSHYVKSETIQNLTAASNPPTKDLIYKECILDDSVWWIIRDSVTLSTGRNILVKPIIALQTEVRQRFLLLRSPLLLLLQALRSSLDQNLFC